MPEPISEANKNLIIGWWLSGSTYRDIHDKMGRIVSTGSISNTIVEAKKRAPDLETLRTLNKQLNEYKANILDALRGAQLLSQIDKSYLSSINLPAFIEFYTRTGNVTAQVIGAGYKVMELYASTGLDYFELVKDIDTKTRTKSVLDTSIKEMQVRIKDIKAELSDLETLKKLDIKLKSKHISHDKLEAFIDRFSKLESLEFTEPEAEILAAALKEHGLTPKTASDKLASIIKKHISFEESLENLTNENVNLENKKKQLEKHIKNLDKEVETLQELRTRTLDLIKKDEIFLQEKKTQLEKDYNNKNNDLKKEHEHQKEIFDQEISKLETRKEKIELECSELNRTLSNISDIEASLEELEKKINKHEKLIIFDNLVREPETVTEPPQLIIELSSAYISSLRRYLESKHDSIIIQSELFDKTKELEDEIAKRIKIKT